MEIMFSIIIPVYKVEAYIDKCINSVLEQNFKNYEIILVDDGSPDACPSICDKYAEANSGRIRVLHKENGGLSSARNTGILFAQGKYLIFLDSDDWLSEHSLENLNLAIERYDYPDVIMNRIEIYDQNSGVVEEGNLVFQVEVLNKMTIEKVYETAFNYKGTILTASVIVARRDYVIKNNLYFIKDLLHEDIHWVPLVVLKCTKYGINDKPLYCYRLNRDGSITATPNIKKLKDLVWIIKDLLKQSKELSQEKRVVLRNWCSLVYKAILRTLYQYNKTMDEYQSVLVDLSKLKYVLKFRKTVDAVFLYASCSVFGIRITSTIINLLMRASNKLRR